MLDPWMIEETNRAKKRPAPMEGDRIYAPGSGRTQEDWDEWEKYRKEHPDEDPDQPPKDRGVREINYTVSPGRR